MSNIFARLSSRKRIAVLGFAVLGFAITVGFQNCGKVGKAKDYVGEDSSSTGKNDGLGTVQIAPVTSQTANLGTKLEIPISITVSPGYSGTLKLEVKTPELGALDPGKAIKFAFDKNTINLTGEISAQAKLTVDVTTLSPSFDLSMFHVQVSDLTRPAITAEISVPIQVKPVYEVIMGGRVNAANASPEKWSVDIRTVTQFISHQAGLTIKFINMDTVPHRVHSGGPVPHGQVDVQPGGGFYMVTVRPSATRGTSTTYCHNHEGGTQGRTFQFNVPVVVPPPPVASNNPDAKFSLIAANILAVSCNGCHSGNNPPAGVNLTTYANVSQFVVPRDASASALYNAVELPNPTMPLNAPALSAAMVKNIQDWINDGALNN